MSFATGMQMGLRARQDAVENERRAAQDQRAAEQHALQMAELRRAAQHAEQSDTAHAAFLRDYNAPPPPVAPVPGVPVQMSRAPAASPGAAFLESHGPAGESGMPMSRAPAAPVTDVTGLPAPGAPDPFAQRRSQLDARRRYYAALPGGRGVAGLQGLETEDRQLRREEAVAKVPEMLKNPEFKGRLNKFINNNSDYVTIEPSDEPGTKGRMVARVVKDDGEVKRVDLSETQYMQLAQAHVLMELGYGEEATKLMREANKDVAEGLERQSRTSMAVGTFNADQTDKADASAHRKATLANDTRRTNASVAESGARVAAAKQVSPATLTKMRDLEVAYANAKTPDEQREIRRQYDIISANAGAEVGRPRGLPEPKGGQMSQQQQLEARAKLKTAGFSDAQIEQMILGYDPWAELEKRLQAHKGAMSTPVDPRNPLGASAGPGSAPAATAPRPSFSAGLADLRQGEKTASDEATRRYLERTGGR